MPNIKIATKLKDIRAASGMTLRDVAKKTRITHTLLFNYEKGVFIPSNATLRRLFRVYKLSIREEVEVYAAAGRVHPDIEKYLVNNTGECRNILRKAGKI